MGRESELSTARSTECVVFLYLFSGGDQIFPFKARGMRLIFMSADRRKIVWTYLESEVRPRKKRR